MKFTEAKLPLFAGICTVCIVLFFYTMTLIMDSLALKLNGHIAVIFLALSLGAFVATVVYSINKLMK